MTTRAENITGKVAKRRADVLGRSPATGRLVLKPASKDDAISLKDARMAVAMFRAAQKT
jgi:hypothetical protein